METLDFNGDGIARGAEISDCRRYRYRLWRHWGGRGEPRLGFLMLNPSVADSMIDDPTIRRCMGFARRERFAGIEVANLYAYRATKPTELWLQADPVGPGNGEAIYQIALRCDRLVCAWGGFFDGRGGTPDRVNLTIKQLRDHNMAALLCLGRTDAGSPRHPLMLRGDTPLEGF